MCVCVVVVIVVDHFSSLFPSAKESLPVSRLTQFSTLFPCAIHPHHALDIHKGQNRDSLMNAALQAHALSFSDLYLCGFPEEL